MSKIYDDRTVSSFGVSIGTGIMLESIFTPTTERYDKDREVPIHLDINTYHIHYYNIYTLARNVITAIPDKLVKEHVFSNDKLINTLIADLNTIAELYSDTKCKPVLFIPKYDKVFKNMNIGKDGSIVNFNYEIYTYILKAATTKSIDIPITVEYGTHLLQSTTKDVLLTTHIPVDLLNVRRIPKLMLMESHTGKLKDKDMWYSKLHKLGKKDLSVFPYIEELVYLLGDKIFVLPYKLSIRRLLHDLALSKHWTNMSSKLKIMSDLNKHSELGILISNYKKIY